MADRLITVFGGTGFIGRNVVRLLAANGERVRVGIRRPDEGLFLKPMGRVGQIGLVQANVRDAQSVRAATEGADAVLNLVGILVPKGKQKFDAVHTGGATTIAEAARDAGAARMVHISAIGADAESRSLYARTKAEGESAVRERFPDATVFRPSIVFGPEDDFFNRFASLSRITPALPLIGGGKTRFQPVYVGDVADAIVTSLDTQESVGETYELGGPNIYTFEEILEYILKVIDRKRLLVPVPWAVASMQAVFLTLWSRVMLGFLGDPVLTRDQVRLLRYDNVVSPDAKGLADLGITPETIEAIVPTYLWRYRRTGQFAPSTE